MSDERTDAKGWPERPETWPDVMTDLEMCLYLRLDRTGRSPANAKRSLRHIRQNKGLPDTGRLGGQVLFVKAAVDTWLARREGGDEQTVDPSIADQDLN